MDRKNTSFRKAYSPNVDTTTQSPGNSKYIINGQIKVFEDVNSHDKGLSLDVDSDTLPAMTWPQVAATIDRLTFLVMSLEIVVSTVILFPYLTIAGSLDVDEASGQMECLTFNDPK